MTATIIQFPTTPEERARFYFSATPFRSLHADAMALAVSVRFYVQNLSSLEYHLLPEQDRFVHAKEAMSLPGDTDVICSWFKRHDGLNTGEMSWEELSDEKRRQDLSPLFMRLSDEGMDMIGPRLRQFVHASRRLSNAIVRIEWRFGFRHPQSWKKAVA